MMVDVMPKMSPDNGSQESNYDGQWSKNNLGRIMMVVTAVNVVLSLSTLILLAVVTSQVGRYANQMPIIATDLTKTALLEVTGDKLMMKNVMSKFVDSLVSQENMDVLMAKMPFILGDPDVNLPAQLAQAVVTELPYIIDYAYKALNHSIDTIENIKADMVEFENADIEAWFTDMTNIIDLNLKDLQKVMALMDATFSETAPDVQRIYDLRKISGIGGAVMSMLGLMPDMGSKNEVIFPLLKWHQSLMDGPKIAPLFEACDKFLDDVLDGPEHLLHQRKFMFNKTSQGTRHSSDDTSDDTSHDTPTRSYSSPGYYDDYGHYSYDYDTTWRETCEFQLYWHQDEDSMFVQMNPTNCTSREVATYSWENSTSTTTTVMCDCTWSASIQSYLKDAAGYYGDEAFRTELVGVKNACSKAASTLSGLR